MRRFLLQMHGESGAGKSTLALAVGRATGAVVLNKDHVAGPLIDEGVLQLGAAGPAYAVFFTLADSFLQQGFSVVLDSPCYWEAILERGRELAQRHAFDYRIVECRCTNELEQESRLGSRSKFSGQPGSRAELIASITRPGVMTAIAAPHLIVDTTRSLESCTEQVMEYLAS